MGLPPFDNKYCPSSWVYCEAWMWPIPLCYSQCNFDTGVCSFMHPIETSCLSGPGTCYYDLLFAVCEWYHGIFLCCCYQFLSHHTCETEDEDASNECDIPHAIQFERLNIFDFTTLWDMYDIPDTQEKVMSIRSRENGINIKVRFDPAEFHEW